MTTHTDEPTTTPDAESDLDTEQFEPGSPVSLVEAGRARGERISIQMEGTDGRLSQLAAVTDPVIAGPWAGEVGYELLYWIPFLRRACAAFPGLSENIVAVSRGGARHWYHGLTSRYVDVFDVMPLEEFLAKRDEEGGGTRQRKRRVPYEQEITDLVAQHLGVRKAKKLHPSLLYKVLRAVFEVRAIHWFRDIAAYEPLPQPELGPLAGQLPDDYIAVKFYESLAFPGTPANRALVGSVLNELTQTTNVVLLNTGMRIDDHSDFEVARPDRVYRIDQFMTPSNNLDIQTTAISRARMFIGTYGGLSYLPPFFNVPSLCFYSEPDKFFHHHLELANAVFRGEGWGDFLAVDTRWIGDSGGTIARIVAESNAKRAASLRAAAPAAAGP